MLQNETQWQPVQKLSSHKDELADEIQIMKILFAAFSFGHRDSKHIRHVSTLLFLSLSSSSRLWCAA